MDLPIHASRGSQALNAEVMMISLSSQLSLELSAVSISFPSTRWRLRGGEGSISESVISLPSSELSSDGFMRAGESEQGSLTNSSNPGAVKLNMAFLLFC